MKMIPKLVILIDCNQPFNPNVGMVTYVIREFKLIKSHQSIISVVPTINYLNSMPQYNKSICLSIIK